MAARAQKRKSIAKSRTGIEGLDLVTHGGLPKGRPTLIAGGAGSGKTLVGMEFLVRGATQFGENGVCITFEESGEEMVQNFASFGHDVNELIRSRKLLIDHVQVERHQIEETGEYDLEGLFIRLDHAIKQVKAKRVLLDTLEVLFVGLDNLAVVRSELARLFRWLKDRGITAVITAETGEGKLTRHGLEEYVADCVIMLDHRVNEQVSTRRLRVVKYRGSVHGTNEYPFLINREGISVLPITSLGLEHIASTERVASGVPGLDAVIDGRGFYRGSSVLVSGTAGTGKSIIAAHFAAAACYRGEHALYFAYEESPSQILRNMRAVGIELEPFIKKGLLRIVATRPTTTGLESHLVNTHQMVQELKPSVVVVDPITNLLSAGDSPAVKSMLTRLVDFLKTEQITALFTNLSTQNEDATSTEISSLMDTWVLVSDAAGANNVRHRELFVLKSRGMAHSNRVHNFEISNYGLRVLGGEARPVVAPVAALPGRGHAKKQAKAGR